MASDEAHIPPNLNEAQRTHLLASFQHADKLLSDVEAILTDSTSKSPFHKYKADITPQQAKVIEDYLTRVRAQMIRALGSQGISPPAPQFGSVHSIRVNLAFATIAFDECRAKSLEGYGAVPDELVGAVDGLVAEMKSIVSKLDGYLARVNREDFRERLDRLENSGRDTRIVKALQSVIDRYGLVEFRPALNTIVSRLESTSFEIAVFGRVSSGKSSLLNHILHTDVLPVGLNPVTAVPTRIAYGEKPAGTVWFADGQPQSFNLSRVSEFVTESGNPGNRKHVTRILLKLPSPALQEGIIFVDTPGLGSLATAGASETRAYLPQCDLGIVLIDAGSTLTPEDIGTIDSLVAAGVQTSVLLSKADLISAVDREQVIDYVNTQIREQLGLTITVDAVSTKSGYTELLDEWFTNDVATLFSRHQQLAEQSIARKIGLLRESVVAALNTRGKPAPSVDPAALADIESELRELSGGFAPLEADLVYEIEGLRNLPASPIARKVARMLVSDAAAGSDVDPTAALRLCLADVAAEFAAGVSDRLTTFAESCETVLHKAARALCIADAPDPGDFVNAVRLMPRMEPSALTVRARPAGLLVAVNRDIAAALLARRIVSEAGQAVSSNLRLYGKILQDWIRKTVKATETRFESYAGLYRAQVSRYTTADPAGSRQVSDDPDLDALLAITSHAENESAA